MPTSPAEQPTTAAALPCAQCGGTDHIWCNRASCQHQWLTLYAHPIRDVVCAQCGTPKWYAEANK